MAARWLGNGAGVLPANRDRTGWRCEHILPQAAGRFQATPACQTYRWSLVITSAWRRLSGGALVPVPFPVVGGLSVLHSGTEPQAGRASPKSGPSGKWSDFDTLVQAPATPPKSREHFCTPT